MVGGRQLGSTGLRRALRDVAAGANASRGGEVFDTAWPMLLQMIALPIAMQTDRIVLSHVSDLKNLSAVQPRLADVHARSGRSSARPASPCGRSSRELASEAPTKADALTARRSALVFGGAAARPSAC